MTEVNFRWQMSGLPSLDKAAAGMKSASLAWGQEFISQLVNERLSGRPGLNRRTGNLSRDWMLEPEADSISVSSHGAADAYAGLQEFGGELRPVNANWLWIPLEANLTPAGVARMTPTQAIQAGGFIQWNKGPIFYLAEGRNAVGGARRLTPYFVLKKSVTIPARMGASTLFESMLPQLGEGWGNAIAGAWNE